MGTFDGRFARAEARQHAEAYLAALMGSSDLSPDGTHRLLNTARWDVDGVRDDLRSLVLAHLGHPSGVLMAGEAAFVRKGDRSAGVHRRFLPSTGQLENCQVGVFLAYRGRKGAALIDRELFLPPEWSADTARRGSAGIPDGVPSTPTDALVTAMIRRAVEAGVPASWVTCAEPHPLDPQLCALLERHRVGYVLPVPADSVGAALLTDAPSGSPDGWTVTRLPPPGGGAQRWILVHGTSSYVCGGPAHTSVATLVRVAAAAGTVAECVAEGLGPYQVRRYQAWYRHMTLAMLAYAHRVCAAVPPTPHARRTRRDPAEKRRRILAAAREVLRERGLRATMDDVATRAGVGIGTVYRAFPDKDALIEAVFGDIVDGAEKLARDAAAESDAWTALTTSLEQVCEAQAFDRGLREVMLGHNRGPRHQAEVGRRIKPLVDELITRAQQQGDLRQDIIGFDLPMIQLMVAAVTDHTGRPDLWRRYLHLLLDGMRARPGAARPLPAPPGGVRPAFAGRSFPFS
ncbi:transposase [Dactylosporangium sp. AC04546]|uniref:IS701 family transposase n=1 Tax=Dactylosporangium sp. AC04546 TaxID=2862460 RepID=UPI001EDFD394|nr:transposase [Dactylosporangium sp. AC04546]WVK86543.1 transposase [Dactylosporangium sp. AC04546]